MRALRLLLALCVAAQAYGSDATFTVEGLERPAEIRIDTWGVPHIYAGTHYDAFFVQGFNAARDRLWQIDLWRRRGLGELAEVLGPAYVRQDRAARLFLFRGDMHAEWLAYGADAKEITRAFVAGVNAYVALTEREPDLLPLEFGVLGYKPARWQPEDVVRIRSNGLWRNVEAEVQRARVLCHFGATVESLRQRLEPAWQTIVPEGIDLCSIPEHVLDDYALAKAPVAFGGAPQTAMLDDTNVADIGSNNWAVAPSRTATGRAILANDPHRAHAVPSLRYAVHLSAPDLDVIGAGEPALPGISIGHNERVAFGLTIFAIDQEDLYVYETSHDRASYRYGDRWEPFRRIDTEIAVHGAEAVHEKLAFTRHGPVVFEDARHHRAYAVRAAWLEPGMAPYFGSIEYMRARGWREFAAALNRWGAPAENQVYADTDGNIGYKAAGLFPRRTNWDGLLPVPGDGRYEWDGFFDADALPVELNPARGYVASANAMNLPADYPIAERRVGFEWAAPWRAQRIDEVLAAQPRHTVADSLALQRDYTSLFARRVIDSLADLPPTPPLEVLRAWNRRLEPDSPAAAFFMIWYQRHLLPALLAANAPREALPAIGGGDSLALLDLLGDRTAASAALVTNSLAAAWDELVQRMGPDPQQWRWGALHQIRFAHPLLGRLPADDVSAFALAPYPRGGSGDTPNATSFRDQTFDVVSGASWRMVVDVGNWDAAQMTNAPGQSGDPRSRFYANLLEGWARDSSFPLVYSRKAVEAATVEVIRLVPR